MIPFFYIFISIVLYMTIHSTLKEAPFFQDAHPGVISICVTALCLLGMNQIVDKNTFNFFLFFYAVLGIALLSVLLLRGLSGARKSKNVDLEKEIPSKTNPDWKGNNDKTE